MSIFPVTLGEKVVQSLIVILSLAFTAPLSPAQGTVNFQNGLSTLVSTGEVGQGSVISGSPGSFYFGLLIASPGTTQTSQFVFSNVYATNLGSMFPGRINGGLDVQVPGWPVNSAMSFLVAGWSSGLGHDWNQEWLSGNFLSSGYFGLSSIATGVSGGPGLPPTPGFNLFGGPTGIQSGWNLTPVPEPVPTLLIELGALISMLWRAVWRKKTADSQSLARLHSARAKNGP